MSDVCVGIKDLLVTAGAGTFAATTGWGIYINDVPSDPNTCIVIKRTGGQPSNPRYLLDYPSVQVMVRGTKNGYQDAEAKMQDVKDVLLGLPSQDINSDRWVAVLAIGDYLPIGKDDNERPLFAMNFSLIIEPAASALTNRTAL